MGRLGLLLGFLVGAAMASFISLAEREEKGQPETGGPAGGVVEALRRQASQAMRVGREAAGEKEAEMQRRFDEATHRAQGA